MFLFSCKLGSSYPEEALRGVEDRAIRTLRTDQLKSDITGLSGEPIELKIVDVTLDDGREERRAFLAFPDDSYAYLGILQQLTPTDPVEFVLFELNGNRFMAIWVDKAAADKPTFVTVARSVQLASDDSMSVLSTGETANRVALIYIPASQASLWQELKAVRVTGSGVIGYAWEKKYDPSVWIDSNFIKVTTP